MSQSLSTSPASLMSGIASMFASSASLPIAVEWRTAEDMAQEAWLKERWGKFTASEMYRLMTNGKTKDGLSVGAMTYVREKVAEVLIPFQTGLDSASHLSTAMEWGKDHELEAIAAFETATGIRVNHNGEDQQFILSDCGNWGGTPDGITFDAGLEVKCPESKTHLLYLSVVDAETLKETEAKYYWQIQACMALTGKSHWHFVSYDPRFYAEHLRLHHCVIERVQEDIDLMLSRIEQAVEKRNEFVERLERRQGVAAND